MKQIIRNNTFETNSSSMHSLVVTKEAKPYSEDEKNFYFDSSYDKEFNLYDCCFDRIAYERFPFEVLNDPLNKLRYYIGWYIGRLEQYDKLDMIKKFLSNKLNLPEDKINLTRHIEDDDFIKDKYVNVYRNDTGEDPFDCLEKHNVAFEEFIMDPRYTIVVDGDEYQEFKKLFDSGIIKDTNIDYISSGIDYWLDTSKSISMYYIDQFSIKDNWQYEDFINSCSTIYLYKNLKVLVIEDFQGWEEGETINKESLELLAKGLEILKSNRCNYKTKIKEK